MNHSSARSSHRSARVHKEYARGPPGARARPDLPSDPCFRRRVPDPRNGSPFRVPVSISSYRRRYGVTCRVSEDVLRQAPPRSPTQPRACFRRPARSRRTNPSERRHTRAQDLPSARLVTAPRRPLSALREARHKALDPKGPRGFAQAHLAGALGEAQESSPKCEIRPATSWRSISPPKGRSSSVLTHTERKAIGEAIAGRRSRRAASMSSVGRVTCPSW